MSEGCGAKMQRTGRLLTDYYADRDVRARLREFLGGTTLDEATSVFVTGNGHSAERWYDPKPVDELWKLLEEGREVARSLWDRRSLIADLDIEYVNFDASLGPYLEPTRTFEIQRPVFRAIQALLLRHGIAPLHLMSGRGHHFVWRIAQDSPAFALLAKIGHVGGTLGDRYSQPQPPLGEVVPKAFGAAFAGLGLLMEFVAQEVLDAAGRVCRIPIELTAVEAVPGTHGREIVSIDVSEYGDPLHVRSVRVPFSAYLKPMHQEGLRGEGAADALLPLFMIPLHEMDDCQAVLAMRDVGAAIDLARYASVRIPDESVGTEELIAAYGKSKLARFHEFFHAARHDPPESWPDTYDRTPLESLPPCARRILQQPNDLLLKPAGIQHVVRVLMAVGWHPRHIAGLIRSKYERDFGWGSHWYCYDAATRADFYTRLFAGLIATGRDALADFDCRSMLAKGYCDRVDCRDGLERLRQDLLERRDALSTLEVKP